MDVYTVIKSRKKRHPFLLAVILISSVVGGFYLAKIEVISVTSGVVSEIEVNGHGSVVNSIDKGCYLQTDNMTQYQHPSAVLTERNCRQTLPTLIIAGGALCGTLTLKRALSYHPDVAVRESSSPLLVDLSSKEDVSEAYRRAMPYSLPKQITVDESPEYMYSHTFQQIMLHKLNRVKKDIKVIFVLRDPVARAMSEFIALTADVDKPCSFGKIFNDDIEFSERKLMMGMYNDSEHVQTTRQEKGGHHNRVKRSPDDQENKSENGKLPKGCRMWEIDRELKRTFEETVTDESGKLLTSHFLLKRSVYGGRVMLFKFMRYRMLILDADMFSRTPADTMALVELFLGLKPFFNKEFFDFDLPSGKFCFNARIRSCVEPIPVVRPLPVVGDKLIADLRHYYMPWMKIQNRFANAYFEHLGEHPLFYTPFR